MKLNMSKRRTVLVSVIAVLAIIFIIQQIVLNISPVSKKTLKEEADTLIITGDQFTTTIEKTADGSYVTGINRYTADSNIAEDMFENASNITVLSKLSSSSSEADNDRYGFTSLNEIKVEVKKDGKVLRTIRIGKKASTGIQTYIRLDDSDDTLLASSRMRDVFNVKEDAVRNKEIYSLETEKIKSVEVTSNGKISLAQRAEDGRWLSGKDGDSSKIGNWVESISTLDAEKWADNDITIDTANAANKVVITTADSAIEVVIIPSENQNEDWLCKSTASEYCFYITETAAKRLLKDPSLLK